ncbi:MAG TPA: ATP-binding cassette domain-containing protein [Gemmatimonadales bacterium]|nr:ATP-binding cassette domain-containing protein [Gemmatimonadales bacterium]
MIAVEIRGLTRRFGATVAVDGLTLDVPRGSLFGLVGPDGAGKTTTLRMLAGVLRPSAGDARLGGVSVVADPERVKHSIAYMSQRFGLYADLTVRENIDFYADLYGVPERERQSRLERLYRFSGLGPFEDRLAGRLSGGMKQKLSLCCALIHHPDILLLDEPTFGVDPISRRELWGILREMVDTEKRTVLVTTSSREEAARCDDIALLDRGRLAPGKQMVRVPPLERTQDVHDSPPAVVVEDLTRSFGDFTAVDRVSFTVATGEIFGFLGPNGAGKTTTIRMLTGLLLPTGGRGTVAGHDILTDTEWIKRRIGYMSQLFSLYGDLTVEENIQLFAGLYEVTGSRYRERRDWVLEMSGLASRRASLTADLPLGFKQRLALGCAVMHEPPILFLDEPTSGVDPVARRAFWELIYGLADRGTTVFVTTHYMEEAEYCHRLALMNRGRLIALDTPAALRAAEGVATLEEVFIRQVERTGGMVAG